MCTYAYIYFSLMVAVFGKVLVKDTWAELPSQSSFQLCLALAEVLTGEKAQRISILQW